jgi:hypothetical protein
MPVLLALSSALLAQSLPVQPCPSDALDATFQAKDGPDHGYTLAINLRNVSAQACWIQSTPGGFDTRGNRLALAPDIWVDLCYYCVNGEQRPSETRIVLAPGESAHETRSWKTEPATDAAQCISPAEMEWPWNFEYHSRFELLSRSLLKPVCSPLNVADYAAGQFAPEPLESLAPNLPVPSVHLEYNPSLADLSGESISLGVTIEDPGHVLLLDERSCPRLFVRARDATPSRVVYSRLTRVDEIQNAVCEAKPAAPSGVRSTFVMEVDASYALTRDAENKGEYAVDASVLAQLNGRYVLIGSANSLHLSMVDGKFIRRNWGPPVEGASVSLTLDKLTYELGAEVPLHIALETAGSGAPIMAMDPYYDPPGVSLELETIDGQKIPAGEGAMWLGHGFCHSFLPGVVYPVELKLSQMGFRPDHPGVYRATAIWKPAEGAEGCANGIGYPPEYLTVTSPPVTFEVVSKPPAGTAPAIPKL